MRRIYSLAVCAALALALAPRAAQTDSHTYSTVRRQVRCAIVMSNAQDIGGGYGPENPDPHIFYVADSRADLKPLGMEFVNPLAPPVITSQIYRRWQARQRPGANPDPAFIAGSPQNRQFQVGTKVTKNMGAYWEINIDNLSAEDLANFDVLLLTGHKNNIAFTAEEREKLRIFVDRGGTLWVDNCGRLGFAGNAPFLYDVQLNSASIAAAGAVIAAPNHALLTYPYIISANELQGIGDKNVNGYFLEDQFDNTIQVPGHGALYPVVWNTRGFAPANQIQPAPGWRPYIMAGQIGAGRLVYTSQDSGCAINDYVGGVNVGYGGNSGAISGEIFIAAHPVDLKFVYNMCNWGSTQTTEATNVRRNGGTSEKMGAVLADKWTGPIPSAGAPNVNKVGGAVQYKNCVFAVDGALVLHCYDARPGEDLDSDGNPDDGLPDYIAGAPYDEIWRLPLKPLSISGNPTGCSTPTVIEFFDQGFANRYGLSTNGLANFDVRDLVVVVLSDGTVIGARALPRAFASGLPLAPFTNVDFRFGTGTNWSTSDYGINNTPHAAADNDSSQDLPIPAAAWSEGILFISVNTTLGGRVVAIDPRMANGGNVANLYHSTAGTYTEDPSYAAVPVVPSAALSPPTVSAPAVGYVKDVASGALDRMVYVYQQRGTTGGVANIPDTLRAYWFATRGEPLTRVNNNTFVSRTTNLWYVYPPDATIPDSQNNRNADLRPRVFHTFRDPGGTVISEEYQFIPGGAAANPGIGQFALSYAGNQMRIHFNAKVAQIDPSTMTQIDTGDERNSFFADYFLDWSLQVGSTVPNRVNARSVFPAPDVQNSGSQIGGSPSLSPEDLLYYTVRTFRQPGGIGIPTGTNPGAGVLVAVNEQNLRTSMKWAYTMHDGFPLTLNGQTVNIPPRLRQLDPLMPGYGNFIYDVQFFGTPAYRNGVIYAVGRGFVENAGEASVVCAFKANPEFKIRLNQRIDPGTPITIKQLNVVNSQNLQRIGQAANSAPQYVTLNPAQYTIDYNSGLIRITSMAPIGTVVNFVSASMPFIVQVGNGPEQLIAGVQVDSLAGGGQEQRLVGPSGVDNLLWYAVIPVGQVPGLIPIPMGYASSSPSVQGDVVWLGFQFGFIASLDADPTSTDPQFQSSGNQVPLFKLVSGRAGHLRAMKQVYDPVLHNAAGQTGFPAVITAPGGTQNVLMVNTLDGALALEDAFTVIADNRRIIEVNAAGDAVWSSDGTRTYTVAGGPLPIFTYDPGTGNVIPQSGTDATGAPVMQNVPFARPTVARRIGSTDLLIVDTGNNRVVQVDRGGNAVWEVHRLFDDYQGLLRPGDPTTLSEPTDVQFWTEFLPAVQLQAKVGGTVYSYSGPAYVVHYLIADTGNYRVIELVDVYDQRGNPVTLMNGANPAPFSMLRQLNFVSSSYSRQGKRLRYRTAQRLAIQNSVLPPAWQVNPFDPSQPAPALRFLTLSAISNAKLVGSGAANTNPDDPSGTGAVIQEAEGQGGTLVVLNEAGNPLSILGNLRIPDANSMLYPKGYRMQSIVNPTSYTAFQEVDPKTSQVVYKYLLSDENGVYQMKPGVDAVTNQPVMDVEWMLTADDYFWMTGKKLRATSVRRLSSSANNLAMPTLHQFLITNRFSGEDNPLVFGVTYNLSGNPANGNILSSTEFHGEAFVIKPSTFDITKTGATSNAPNQLHGYSQDYIVNTNMLLANPLASITFRTPTETVPIPGVQTGAIRRTVGDPDRATTSAVLDQPSYADRPF